MLELKNHSTLAFAILGITLFFTITGVLVSPLDPLSQRPMLYTPRRQQLSEAQKDYERWLLLLDQFDQSISDLLIEEETDLMGSSIQLDQLISESQILMTQIQLIKENFPAQPPIITISNVSSLYHLTIESLELYYLNPTSENLVKAQELLSRAQQQKQSLTEAQWNLTT